MTGGRRYRTIKNRWRESFDEKRSLFHADIFPVETEEEALQRLRQVKQQEPAATHHVYAYVLGGRYEAYYQRFSDDGEPQGTAGRPVLEALLGHELRDVLLVVTRYFGGTLLGAGGLVRAYSRAASLVIDAAEVVTMEEQWTYDVDLPYAMADRFRYFLRQQELSLLEERFSEQTGFTISLPQEKVEMVQAFIAELTAGEIQASKGQLRFVALFR